VSFWFEIKHYLRIELLLLKRGSVVYVLIQNEHFLNIVTDKGCPHAAIREDITSNLIACEELTAKFHCDLVLLESGGDNLAADFSRSAAHLFQATV